MKNQNRRNFFKKVFALGLTTTLYSNDVKKTELQEINYKQREPFISMKDGTADYIGKIYQGGFCGSKIILNIGEWDGVGYPVELQDQSFGTNIGSKIYYDFELANLRLFFDKMTPEMKIENRKYINIHSYVRAIRGRCDWEKFMNNSKG